ncbi:hypothetical protein [Kordia sp.]|uniref:hypothetical protein n=1 Tax=Kordia sp. TaxID=1965332 RepID=UPI0025C3D451|nr:hypothetical protein [Kordia sp.]MCH2195492.1 hypothetical protein [Kordia sp.]
MEQTLIQPLTKNTILAGRHEQFEWHRIKDIPAVVKPQAQGVSSILENFDYPVSSWPIILKEEQVATLKQLSARIPRLIRKIPELYFKNDEKRIADFYFKGDAMLTQFAMLCHQKNIDVGCRLDLTYAEDGFKLLEVNVGSTVGGWQVQVLEEMIRKCHPQLDDPVTASQYESPDTQAVYIKFLVENVIKHVKPTDKEVNVFFGVGHIPNEEIKKRVLTFFDNLLNEELAKKGMKGRSHTGRFSSLVMKHGRLYCGDAPMHGVIAFKTEQDDEIQPDVFRAFIMDEIYFPDNLTHGMNEDKRNLEILLELAQQKAFSEEDNALILKHIPWSAAIADKKVSYAGKMQSVENILREHKDKMVIKDALGFQGIDVFVGKFASDEEWEKAIQLAFSGKNFLAQEFHQSIDYVAPNLQQEWTDHKIVWGSFGFGDHYGGVCARSTEVATDVGIINCARGAVVAIVYGIKN